MSAPKRKSSPPELEPYRDQAGELEEALAKVKGIHEQTAAVTLQRETVLQQRQGLLDSWVESENEASVEELAKVKRIEDGFVPPDPFTLAQWQATVTQGSVAAAA
jgi:hypothetical protein